MKIISLSYTLAVLIALEPSLGSAREKHLRTQTKADQVKKEEATKSLVASERKVEFKIEKMGDGLTKKGGHFYFLELKASDGNTLYQASTPFDSPTACADELQAIVKDAAKIIERGPKFDKEGRTVGERILALFPTEDPHKTQVRLFWTNGPMLHEIDSDSLLDALALEKRGTSK